MHQIIAKALSNTCHMMNALTFLMGLTLLSSVCLNAEEISESLRKSIDMKNLADKKFGKMLYRAINEEGLNNTRSKNKRKRVKLSDVPYFDILNRNRDFRRQIINPSQLPRQPKEKWGHFERNNGNKQLSPKVPRQLKEAKDDFDQKHKVKATDERLVEETSSSNVEKVDSTSMKKFRQLQPYGPKLLEALGIHYRTYDRYHPTYPTYSHGRSLDKTVIKEAIKNKENDTKEPEQDGEEEQGHMESMATTADSTIDAALSSNSFGHAPHSNLQTKISNTQDRYSQPIPLNGFPPYPVDEIENLNDQPPYISHANHYGIHGGIPAHQYQQYQPQQYQEPASTTWIYNIDSRPGYGTIGPLGPPLDLSIGPLGPPLDLRDTQPVIASSGVTQKFSSFGENYYPSSPSPYYVSSQGISSIIPQHGNRVNTQNYVVGGSYYGIPYSRNSLTFPEARKKGVTVGKVVGGALAAGNFCSNFLVIHTYVFS